MRPDPACPICGTPIEERALVVLERHELLHVRCRLRATQKAAGEEIARAREVQDSVAETKERTARLLEELRRRRQSGGREGL